MLLVVVGQTRMAKCRDGFEKRTLRFSTAGSQFGFYVKPRSRGIEARDALQGSKKTYEIARNTSFTVKCKYGNVTYFSNIWCCDGPSRLHYHVKNSPLFLHQTHLSGKIEVLLSRKYINVNKRLLCYFGEMLLFNEVDG